MRYPESNEFTDALACHHLPLSSSFTAAESIACDSLITPVCNQSYYVELCSATAKALKLCFLEGRLLLHHVDHRGHFLAALPLLEDASLLPAPADKQYM